MGFEVCHQHEAEGVVIMDKRAATESYSFLIGLLVTVMFVAVFVIFLVSFLSTDEQDLSRAKELLIDISSFYNGCLGVQKTGCVCGSFNVSGIRDAGYSLFLSRELGQSHLLLVEKGVTRDSDGLISKDDVLAKSSFDGHLVCTLGYDGFELEEFPSRVYDLTTSMNHLDEVTVLKVGSKACVLPDRYKQDYERDFAGCYAELPSDKLLLLDSADDVASRQIANFLYPRLVKDVGRVDAFFMGDYDGRSEWFDSVYVKEKEKSLAGKIFFVHVRTSVDAAKGSKDRFVVHYLQDSVSEPFARSVGLRLQVLEGSYYYNSVEKADVGTVPEKYMFNTGVVYEANNAANPDGLYLVCENDELPICRENLQVPSVFVEIIDGDDGFSAYQGHEEILAETIKEGVLDYVKASPVLQSEPEASDESLFR